MDLYKPYTFTIIPGCFSCQLLNCLRTDMQYLFYSSSIEGHIFFENKASSKLVKTTFCQIMFEVQLFTINNKSLMGIFKQMTGIFCILLATRK